MACGSRLQPLSTTRESRRTVTVLFTDVLRSTELGDRLDPETLRHIMSVYFEEMSAALRRHGGTVEKFIGDAIMAVFGLPELHEDDALRAVRAAIDMRAALQDLNETLDRDWGTDLRVRTGINTGEVVAGDPAAGQTLVTGDAVNVAARLEQTARPGEILLGAGTYALVKDAIRSQPIEDLELRGKSEPVTAYRLLGVLDLGPRQVRLDSPLVGRDRELAVLEQALDRVASEGSCALVTILGPGGIGKSRLVAELVARAGDSVWSATGRCPPYGDGLTFVPVVELIAGLAGINRDDSAEVLRAKLAGLLNGTDRANAILEIVEGLFTVAAASASYEETFWAVRRTLEAAADRGRPVLVTIEDLQWAEPMLLDLIEHLADSVRGLPLLLICTARPELLDHRPGWGGGKFNATSILIEPLNENTSKELIANLVANDHLSSELEERVIETAEGNPLYVEEVLAMMFETGARVETMQIPPTINALVSARLDRLGNQERAIAGAAAVIGRTFETAAVAELADGTFEAAENAVQILVRKELVRPERSPGAYRFRHATIRDAAYQALPKERRAELHEQFAEWLRKSAGDEAPESAAVIGYHLAQSCTYRRELGISPSAWTGLAERAAQWLSTASAVARRRCDTSAALELVEHALNVAPSASSARKADELALARLLLEVGDFPRARNLITKIREAAAVEGDVALECKAAVELGMLAQATNEGDALKIARDTARRAIEVLEPLGDDDGLARAWLLHLSVPLLLMRSADGIHASEQAAEYARRAGNNLEERDAHFWTVLGLIYGPTPVEDAITRCADIYDDLDASDLLSHANRSIAIGRLEAMRGDAELGRRMVAEGRAVVQELGMLRHWAGTSMQAAELELESGHPVAAEEVLRPAFEKLTEIGEKSYLSTMAGFLAEALYEQGRHDEAVELTTVAEEAASPTDLLSQIIYRTVRAKIAARAGRLEEAEQLIQTAALKCEDTDCSNDRARVFTDLAEVLAIAGLHAKSWRALNEALELYTAKGNVPGIERIRARLAEHEHSMPAS